jgi:hypothetical protein
MQRSLLLLSDGGRNQSRKLREFPAFLRLFVHLGWFSSFSVKVGFSSYKNAKEIVPPIRIIIQQH